MALPDSSRRRLKQLTGSAEHALEVLGKLGVDHAEVGVGHGNELEVTVRDGRKELVKEAQSSGMSVRVIRDGRVATTATTDLAPEAVERFLANAVEMAGIGEEDPMAAPPEPPELVHQWPDLDLFDARTDQIPADRALELALAAERSAFESDDRIVSSDGTAFGRSSGHSVLATTGGFLGTNAGTYQSLVVQAVADDEGGKKRNGVYWSGARFFDQLEGPEQVGVEAASRAIRSIGAQKIPSGKYPVVFFREAARSIVALFAGCVLGDAIYRQRSYLATKLGQGVGSKLVDLIDDPLIERAPGSRPYDGEGRRVGRIAVVRQGELGSFLLDTYSARKLKLSPTGSASGGGGIPHSSISNFFLERGQSDPDSLIEGIERGLYVTRMMGFGFDPVTGNLSRGAEGFLIENGELTIPVGEITISRNLDELLHGIDAVGSDLEHKTSVSAPSFRVDSMTVAGS